MDEQSPGPLPSTATEEGQYWIHERPPTPAKDNPYYEMHDVTRREDLTEDDLPPTDQESVRDLDREALTTGHIGGKWNVFLPPAEVDAAWVAVRDLIDERRINAAKVSTAWSLTETGRDDHVIVVYTPNYFDRDDVFRVCDALRDACELDEPIYYKPNLWTYKDIYADTADEFGLPGASRYSG